MFTSIARTFIPVLAGLLLSRAAAHGLNLSEGAVIDALTITITTLYYTAGRLLERHVPWLGHLLLSAGTSTKEPVYQETAHE